MRFPFPSAQTQRTHSTMYKLLQQRTHSTQESIIYLGDYYLHTRSTNSSQREHILQIPPTENTFYKFLPQRTHSTNSSHRGHILHIPPTFSNCINIFESESVDDIPPSPPPPPLPPHFPWPPSDPPTPSLPK